VCTLIKERGSMLFDDRVLASALCLVIARFVAWFLRDTQQMNARSCSTLCQ
jgi:hypothetical protein